DKACEATGAGNSDRVGDGFLGQSPDLARNQGYTVGGCTQGMKTTFNKGDGVVDAHAGLIAGDDRLTATSSILLAKRNGRRNHLARMKGFGADIGIVGLWCARRAVAFVAISMGYLDHLRSKVHFDPKSIFQEVPLGDHPQGHLRARESVGRLPSLYQAPTSYGRPRSYPRSKTRDEFLRPVH